mmetsp:Transcript_107293/g.311725  ORF Transcript_107293/g.311725 Transcript_107293/m.311725 type:complete len:278 (-) Transcript_107293:231-1064(-)
MKCCCCACCILELVPTRPLIVTEGSEASFSEVRSEMRSLISTDGVVLSPNRRCCFVSEFSEARSLITHDGVVLSLPNRKLARPGSKLSWPIMSRWHPSLLSTPDNDEAAADPPVDAPVAVESGSILIAVTDKSTSLLAPTLSGVTRCRLTFGLETTAASSARTGLNALAPSSRMITSSSPMSFCCASTEGKGSPFTRVPRAGAKLDIALAMPSLQSTTCRSWSSTTSCMSLLCHACTRDWCDTDGSDLRLNSVPLPAGDSTSPSEAHEPRRELRRDS